LEEILIEIIEDLNKREISFKVLRGEGVYIDTTIPVGKTIFYIFTASTEFEKKLSRKRIIAGLKAARVRVRKYGIKFKLTKAIFL